MAATWPARIASNASTAFRRAASKLSPPPPPPPPPPRPRVTAPEEDPPLLVATGLHGHRAVPGDGLVGVGQQPAEDLVGRLGRHRRARDRRIGLGGDRGAPPRRGA